MENTYKIKRRSIVPDIAIVLFLFALLYFATVSQKNLYTTKSQNAISQLK